MKVDLACGRRREAGFLGADIRRLDCVDFVVDLRGPWPWKDGEIEEATCSHFLEHLEGMQRIHFMNELYRVLRDGAKATIIVPNWTSNAAYAHLDHKWPPVVEGWFNHLNRAWRQKFIGEDPTAYKCDFDWTYAYTSLNPRFVDKPIEEATFAANHYREGAQEIVFTLTKRV